MNKHPYTYTILRYVHDTSTCEFANVGVVLSSPEAHYATAILRPTYTRLSRMFPGFDGDHFRSVVRHLQSRFDEITNRVHQEMDLGQKPAHAHEMAFSVIAPDDSSFQWSPMGSGLSTDLAATAESIYERMVENVLHKTPVEHDIIRENEAEHFVASVAGEIEAHDKETQKTR